MSEGEGVSGDGVKPKALQPQLYRMDDMQP